ncbi:MAG: MoxR family ATPase [Thermoproteota archaeon]|nr:MoxR family ATPase [Thermoproteota archaeon]
MTYKKLFDPNEDSSTEVSNRELSAETLLNIENFGDRSSKSVYVYDDNVVLKVNIAIATGRPLLVLGYSGYGKSSLARNVANVLGWRYYEKVITSRTQARDLLWEVDMIRRLQDAQGGALNKDINYYIRPGVLWEAFHLKSAMEQEAIALSSSSACLSSSKKKNLEKINYPAVVLLDEIDKAEPDFPNNLLVPLGSHYFTVEETEAEVKCDKPPLVIITTNGERDLPPAFLRRCVILNLLKPDLLEVGKKHFEEHVNLVVKVASLLGNIEVDKIETEQGKKQIQSSPLSPAEFIDFVKACINLKIENPAEIWDMIIESIEWKQGRKERW